MSSAGTQDDYAGMVAARVAEEEAMMAGEDAGKKEGGESKTPDMGFIRKCFLNNEIGDSLLYNSVHRDHHVYNVISDRWMTYVGPHWEIDHHKRSLRDVESVAEQYLPLLEDIEVRLDQIASDKEAAGERKALINQRKAIVARLDKLRSHTGRLAVLKCAVSNAEPLTVHPDSLDTHPWLLPVKNGVVDLRTGEFRPGRPDDYFTMSAPTEWKGLDEPAPNFFAWLESVFDFIEPIHREKKWDVIDFLLRVLGYAITGLNTERVFVVLHGDHGQNGKGTLLEILYHVLGELAGVVQTEMLMATKFAKGADGPSPAVMSLKGLRLAWASETDDGQSFANGKLKLYSGGDPLVGRKPNDRDNTRWIPTHTLFLLCNNLPHAPAHDSAFWERIKVIEFPLSFVKRPKRHDEEGNELPPDLEKHQRLVDPGLMEKLKAESSGILAALVRGCLEWQRQGLNPPRKIVEDSLKYRRQEDDIQDFIDQCCRVDPADPDCKTTAKELYGRYRIWWEEVATTKPMGIKKWGNLMSQKFEKHKASSIVYLGVAIKFIGEEMA